MMKNLLQQKILLGLLVMLTANLASAADDTCKFYPKQARLMEEFLTPTPSEEANSKELIGKLALDDIVAARPLWLSQDGVAFAREGDDTWTIRRTAGSNKKPALYASVHGQSNVAQKWLPDYHRALNTTLRDSLSRGVAINIATLGKCD